MKKYKIRFTGRLKGSIGKFCKFTEMVEAENEDKAILKLYDKYDHIRLTRCEE